MFLAKRRFKIEAMLLTVLRVLATIAGSVAFYALLFMYEDEQRKWQNRIDLLWAKIDDRAKLTGSKTSAFFNQVSIVVPKGPILPVSGAHPSF